MFNYAAVHELAIVETGALTFQFLLIIPLLEKAEKHPRILPNTDTSFLERTNKTSETMYVVV